MAFKIKQEKTAPEVDYARSKLEEALQNIVEKDDSPTSSEDECNKGLSDIVIKREPSPVSSPTKKPTQRTQRKRRRKDETLNKNANSYIMKLFDRAVDLTPFNEDTPLYPVCRAWINNQSLFKNNPVTKEEPANEEPEICEDSDKPSENPVNENVHQLPRPLPTMGKDLRIPSPIPHLEEPFIICSDDQNKFSKESLLTNHLQHWKAVRQKWKQAAKTNEERYKESGTVLRSMFERAQCREEVLASEQWDGLSPVS